MANANMDAAASGSIPGVELSNKYKDMVSSRKEYDDLDISDTVPTLEEMMNDDLMSEFLKEISENSKDDVVSTAFYLEDPGETTTSRYDADEHVFYIKCNRFKYDERSKILNETDGDTMRFNYSDLDLGFGFTLNGKTYNSFEDYCVANLLKTDSLNSVIVRSVGIDAPEIPHFAIQAMKPENVVTMTYEEAKNKGALLLNYNYKSGKASKRNATDTVKLYKNGNNYVEITKEESMDKYLGSGDKKSGYVYYRVLSSEDKSEEGTLADGYKAKDALIDLLNSSSEIMLKLDANGTKATKTSSKYKLYYNHWWNAHKVVSDMIDQWQDSVDIPLSRLSYCPFGTDGLGRFLGEIYVKKNINGKEVWINANKYILANHDFVIGNPDFNNSAELNNIYGNVSSGFNLPGYNKDNQIFLDSFEEQTKDSYGKRLEFHKKITGIDFTKFRNCTMMLGDTLFLIPPTSIRSVTNVEYERVNILRGKGSMVKGMGPREHYLEIDLFFYDEAGINGIPTEVSLPSGEKVTYYMNGLRSLLAQFKLTPYLPIESQYINDVLGIETVTLVNMHVGTVDGYPRLLKATLTLRDFNYRIYMPDIPIDYENADVSEISQMNPIFAKCIHWEVFRYYYQRLLHKGSLVKKFDYNSTDYLETYYYNKHNGNNTTVKTALQPIKFCNFSDKISFYVPDEDWLKNALSIKKEEDYTGQKPKAIELSKEAKNWLKEMARLNDSLKLDNNAVSSIKQNCYVGAQSDFSDLGDVTIETNYVYDSNYTNLQAKGSTRKQVVQNYIKPLMKNIDNGCLGSSVVRDYKLREQLSLKDNSIKWYYDLYLDKSTLSQQDFADIKEVLKDTIDAKSVSDIFQKNILTLTITLKYNNQKVSSILITDGNQIPKTLKTQSSVYDGQPENDTNKTVEEDYNYRDPAAMRFRPFIESVPLNGLAFGLTNTFTELSLKIMDGSAPQYMGSSDTYIELSIITDDQITVSMLNTLPAHAYNIAKQYRRILSCWPIRVKNQYLQMAGINEVLIDNVAVETIEGYPGLYEIKMRLTSVDRAMRQREMMQQLQSKQQTSNKSDAAINDYFDIEKSLANAETYPDLDLPLLKELRRVGFNFIRYAGEDRVFPDPDFYMIYGFEYTSKIIKRNIKEVFAKQVFHTKDVKEGGDSVRQVELTDALGQQVRAQIVPTSGFNITEQGELSDLYDQAMKDIMADSQVSIPKKGNIARDEIKYSEESAEVGNMLYYLTICDPTEGWEIKPGFVATMAPTCTNEAVEKCRLSNLSTDKTDAADKSNQYAQDIFNKRKETIELIDSILSEPIDYKLFSRGEYKDPFQNEEEELLVFFNKVVKNFFKEYEKGNQLLKLLCPIDEYDKNVRADWNWATEQAMAEDVHKTRPLGFLLIFLMAAACVQSGNEPRTDSNAVVDWGPNQFNKNGLPRCKTSDGRQAKSEDSAIKYGIEFGMFGIRQEAVDKIKNRILPKGKVKYTSNTLSFYDKYKDGFIDPYYNKLASNSEELKEYKKYIATDHGVNATAFIRVALVYLRKQIIDGYYFSEIDFVLDNWEETKAAMVGEEGHSFWEFLQGGFQQMEEERLEDSFWEKAFKSLAPATKFTWLIPGTKSNEEAHDNIDEDRIEVTNGVSENQAKTLNALMDNIPETYAKSFCARLIYFILEAAANVSTGPDESIMSYLENRRFDVLNSLTSCSIVFGNKTNAVISKFLSASAGYMTNVQVKEKAEASTTSDSQKALNSILKEAYTSLAEDVQAYTLHSFYDMLVNDKRGRLLRAFPTYYITFIDEGRKIGSWKLFDNFYNMSSISDLTVTKTRKMPADTCIFNMSNMFASYANAYDNTTKEQYVDVYSFKDVFTSIFSPKTYIQKENAIRMRQEIGDTVVLQPGIRIHVRMGYGANASKLPTVFNGKIAEIDVGDVVSIVAQGDGHELMNPLNALGETDATNIIESQTWTTLFKDLRGSMNRGGLTPRNLLVQLLTAQHGGVFKTVAREWSTGRFYSDNPFGIYHFGDRRFRDIFEESELVQNLYEVVDGTLLAGVNELYPSETNTQIAPTVNTNLQDKTFWDILQLCAYCGHGYIGAVRDFGFRSTVFLGKPNHYYAFKYNTKDGKFVEKRKPFQQFHYYDSYTDIVYNSIKASEKNMKTNATGIWEGSDWLWWGQESKTVGPMYLDINIYPEYQKSMTVDTGLVGVGNGGIDIPFITYFSEEWNMDAETNKVNKSLAERVTMNALRESVMGMYVGEICVIGDPSVKPYDRIAVNDSYEDMIGQMEVEGVVYSMNAQTGFTTTIYPDVIVRSEDNHEGARQSCFGGVVASCVAAVGTRLMLISKLARIESKLLTTAAGLISKYMAAGATESAAVALLGSGPVAGLLPAPASAGAIASLKSAIASIVGSVSATTLASIAALAAVIYVAGKNAKSYITRWIRNTQVLDVYPVFKNQRPLIAGMAGHKGSVVGYDYTEQDAKDSVQGMIASCVDWLDESLWGGGKYLTNIFVDRDEYNKCLVNWSNTLKTMNVDQEYLNNIKENGATEALLQDLYGEVSKDFAGRSATIQNLKTKYRLASLTTNNGSNPTYKRYENLFVSPYKLTNEERLKNVTDTTGRSTYNITSIYSNKNILDLYPIEDDPEIKKAVAGSHQTVKRLTIAHNQGNVKVTIPFESGPRIIRYIASDNISKNKALMSFPIMDLPMVQEDSLCILKLILNDQYLKKKEVSFLSGARINDPNTWKNTGFWFVIGSDDITALENAVKSVQSTLYWTKNGSKQNIFTYKKNGDKIIINVYPEA